MNKLEKDLLKRIETLEKFMDEVIYTLNLAEISEEIVSSDGDIAELTSRWEEYKRLENI